MAHEARLHSDVRGISFKAQNLNSVVIPFSALQYSIHADINEHVKQRTTPIPLQIRFQTTLKTPWTGARQAKCPARTSELNRHRLTPQEQRELETRIQRKQMGQFMNVRSPPSSSPPQHQIQY